MEVLARLLFLLVLIAAGVGLRAVGVLREPWVTRLNAVAYYAALPALIFVSTAGQPVGEIVSPALLGGLVGIYAVTIGLAFLVHRRRSSPARRSVAIVQSYHSNLGYLGVPLVAATFDERVAAIASVILGVVALLQVPASILILTTINGASTSIRREAGRLLTNPVLASLLAGLGVGVVGVAVPQPATAGLDALGSLALPLALLCVGATLQVDLEGFDLEATGTVVAINVLAMPALAWVVFAALDVGAETFTAAVVMLATPTAVSTYVFAAELGGDDEFASLNVFVTTVVSIGTLFALIAVLG